MLTCVLYTFYKDLTESESSDLHTVISQED